MNEKDELRERLLRGGKKEKSYAEKKRLRELARRRKSERHDAPPRRRTNWEDADEFADEPADERSTRRQAPPALPAAAAERAGERALVVALAPGRARVRFADGECDAPLALPLRAAQQTVIAVGDDVLVERRALVHTVLPRRTWLARPDPAVPERERVLAANVDQVLIVASIAEPDFKPGFVDRVCLALGSGGVRARLVVTKWDLASPAHERALDAALEAWRELALDALRVSTHGARGLAELREALDGRRSVLVGHSGVGKSSLVNALAPALAFATGAVRASDGKGRHTTTRAQLVELWPGTELVDTPGVRQFGLWRITRDDVRAHFAEFAAHAAACRFADCSHLVEPGCGVRDAAHAGEIASGRFALYARLWRELAGDDRS